MPFQFPNGVTIPTAKELKNSPEYKAANEDQRLKAQQAYLKAVHENGSASYGDWTPEKATEIGREHFGESAGPLTTIAALPLEYLKVNRDINTGVVDSVKRAWAGQEQNTAERQSKMIRDTMDGQPFMDATKVPYTDIEITKSRDLEDELIKAVGPQEAKRVLRGLSDSTYQNLAEKNAKVSELQAETGYKEGELFRDPINAIAKTTVESIAAMAIESGGMGLINPFATFAASFAQEYPASIREEMHNASGGLVDFGDPKALKAFYESSEAREAFSEGVRKGTIRGPVIGAVEALMNYTGLAVGTQLAKGAKATSKMTAKEVAKALAKQSERRVLSGAVADIVGGGAGESLARAAAGQEQSLEDTLLESFGEMASVGPNLVTEASRKASGEFDTKVSDLPEADTQQAVDNKRKFEADIKASKNAKVGEAVASHQRVQGDLEIAQGARAQREAQQRIAEPVGPEEYGPAEARMEDDKKRNELIAKIDKAMPEYRFALREMGIDPDSDEGRQMIANQITQEILDKAQGPAQIADETSETDKFNAELKAKRERRGPLQNAEFEEAQDQKTAQALRAVGKQEDRADQRETEHIGESLYRNNTNAQRQARQMELAKEDEFRKEMRDRGMEEDKIDASLARIRAKAVPPKQDAKLLEDRPRTLPKETEMTILPQGPNIELGDPPIAEPVPTPVAKPPKVMTQEVVPPPLPAPPKTNRPSKRKQAPPKAEPTGPMSSTEANEVTMMGGSEMNFTEFAKIVRRGGEIEVERTDASYIKDMEARGLIEPMETPRLSEGKYRLTTKGQRLAANPRMKAKIKSALNESVEQRVTPAQKKQLAAIKKSIGIVEGDTLRQGLQKISKSSEVSESVRTVAAELAKRQILTPSALGSRSRRSGGYLGTFYHDDMVTNTLGRRGRKLATAEQFAKTFVHEAVHAAIQPWIEAQVLLPKSKQSPEYRRIVELETIAYKAATPQQRSKYGFYGLSSATKPNKRGTEFVTEALSNKDFMEFLDGIPVESTGKSVWQSLIDTIASALGLKSDSTVLSETIKATMTAVEGFTSVEEVAETKTNRPAKRQGPTPVKDAEITRIKDEIEQAESEIQTALDEIEIEQDNLRQERVDTAKKIKLVKESPASLMSASDKREAVADLQADLRDRVDEINDIIAEHRDTISEQKRELAKAKRKLVKAGGEVSESVPAGFKAKKDHLGNLWVTEGSRKKAEIREIGKGEYSVRASVGSFSKTPKRYFATIEEAADFIRENLVERPPTKQEIEFGEVIAGENSEAPASKPTRRGRRNKTRGAIGNRRRATRQGPTQAEVLANLRAVSPNADRYADLAAHPAPERNKTTGEDSRKVWDEVRFMLNDVFAPMREFATQIDVEFGRKVRKFGNFFVNHAQASQKLFGEMADKAQEISWKHPEVYKALDVAMAEGDTAVIRELATNYGFLDEYKKARRELEYMLDEGQKRGMEVHDFGVVMTQDQHGNWVETAASKLSLQEKQTAIDEDRFVREYWPRAVTDYKEMFRILKNRKGGDNKKPTNVETAIRKENERIIKEAIERLETMETLDTIHAPSQTPHKVEVERQHRKSLTPHEIRSVERSRTMTEDQEAEFLTRLITGYEAKDKSLITDNFFSERKFTELDKELQHLYQDSFTATENFSRRLWENLAKRDLIGYKKTADDGSTDVSGLIGDYMNKLKAEGKLSDEKLNAMETVITSILNNKSISPFGAIWRDVTTMTLLGNAVAATLNLADVVLSIFTLASSPVDLWHAMASVTGAIGVEAQRLSKSAGRTLRKRTKGKLGWDHGINNLWMNLDLADIGVDDEALRSAMDSGNMTDGFLARTAKGARGSADTTMTLSGFRSTDRVGRQVGSEMAFRVMKRNAKKAKSGKDMPVIMEMLLEEGFSEEDQAKILYDLEHMDKPTPLVKELISNFSSLLAPRNATDMPARFARGGTYTKLSYQLMGFMLNRLNLYIKLAKYTKNKKGRRTAHLFALGKLGGVAMMAEGGAMMLQNLMLGREEDDGDFWMNLMARMVGLNRFTLQNISKGRWGAAAYATLPIGPKFAVPETLLMDMVRVVDRASDPDKDLTLKDIRALQITPIVGRQANSPNGKKLMKAAGFDVETKGSARGADVAHEIAYRPHYDWLGNELVQNKAWWVGDSLWERGLNYGKNLPNVPSAVGRSAKEAFTGRSTNYYGKTKPSAKFQYKGEQYEMAPQEYQRFVQRLGVITKSILGDTEYDADLHSEIVSRIKEKVIMEHKMNTIIDTVKAQRKANNRPSRRQ